MCDGRTWIVYGRRSFPRRLDVTELGRRGMTIAAGRFVELRS